MEAIDVLKDILEYRARGFIPEISNERFKAIQWAIDQLEKPKRSIYLIVTRASLLDGLKTVRWRINGEKVGELKMSQEQYDHFYWALEKLHPEVIIEEET